MKAYRLGKFLLAPFRWMKNLCKHKIMQNKKNERIMAYTLVYVIFFL